MIVDLTGIRYSSGYQAHREVEVEAGELSGSIGVNKYGVCFLRRARYSPH